MNYNSSDGVIFVKRRALDGRFLDKNTGFRRAKFCVFCCCDFVFPNSSQNSRPGIGLQRLVVVDQLIVDLVG